MRIKITLFIFVFLLTSCSKLGLYFGHMYLSHIEITNSIHEGKSTIYFECDIFGDIIVEIPYHGECRVPINQLWKNTNWLDNRTVKRIHDKIIRKHNFKIYRYKNGEKQYFSFKKLLNKYPYMGCTWMENIDNVAHVFYGVFPEEEFWD